MSSRGQHSHLSVQWAPCETIDVARKCGDLAAKAETE